MDLTEAKPGSALDTLNRIRKDRDDLREALLKCPQYIICAYREGKEAGLSEDTLKHAQSDFDFVNDVLARTQPR